MGIMEKFESFLISHLPVSESFHPHYEASLRQMLTSGGKRFRPALLLDVVRAYNPLMVESAYHVALSIELLHTYSLIHDDLPAMDNDDFRRGQPTCHKKFGEDIAILAGDTLNTFAFELLAKELINFFPAEKVIIIIEKFAQSLGVMGMAGGQVLDLKSEQQYFNEAYLNKYLVHQL